LYGEFLKTNSVPDGRCFFKTTDPEVIILCFFKEGRKLRGPQLIFDQNRGRVEIRSKTWTFNGKQACTLAVIEKDKPGKTGYFIDSKLVKSVPFVEEHTLDWLLEDQKTDLKRSVTFDGGRHIGQCSQDKSHLGRGIHAFPGGTIILAYFSKRGISLGNFLISYYTGRLKFGVSL